MKLIKRITSTMLSMTIIAGAAAADIPVKMTTSATEPTNSVLLRDTVISEMGKRIADERAKFEKGKTEEEKSKGLYWNHKEDGSIDGEYNCTTTPCDHFLDYAKNEIRCNHTRGVSEDICQCYGFAYLLAKDIWETTEFYEYSVDDNYEPQIGDNVRLSFKVEPKNDGDNTKYDDQGHSIFITDISEDGDITFAECNGDLKDCKIVWNRTQYYDKIMGEKITVKDKNGIDVEKKHVYGYDYGDKKLLPKVTKDYLRQYATEYYRPMIAGDLNLNGKLDDEDAQIFKETIMAYGDKLDYMPDGETASKMNYYDVNGDGYVNKDDYNILNNNSNGAYKPRIVKPSEEVHCQYRALPLQGGFRTDDGGYYIKNAEGRVTWIGNVNYEMDELKIPSTVNKDGCEYTVTEIGYDVKRYVIPYEHCTKDYKINTIEIPDTVKIIHPYAFNSWSLTSLRFSGSDPQLETISDYAFYGCTTLETLDLSQAKNLKSIGNNAFYGCAQLNKIILPYTGKKLELGSHGESILGNVDPSDITIEFKNQNSVFPMGDLNMNMVIDEADIELLKNYLNASGSLNENRLFLADLDYDGDIDYNDFKLLTKKYDKRFDLNGDKLNDNNDFALLQCVLTKKKKLSEEQTYKADNNNDGIVDAKDAEEMINYLAKRYDNYTYYRMGDLNLDGTVDKNDLTALQKYGNNHIPFKADYKLADLNFDGKVDESDYKILKVLTKYHIGDVDFSGTVDIADRDLIMKHITESELLPDDALWYADINGDGAIDVNDIKKLCADYNIPDYKLGDVDFNGTVDITDKDLIMNHIVRNNLLPDAALSYADVNRDGTVDILDVVTLYTDHHITG